ncbi:hypothetical protein H6G64_13050 [Calothrix sp. FACHB-156]|nr:hypothetical protein [Calothrix sp. FACHB-156]
MYESLKGIFTQHFQVSYSRQVLAQASMKIFLSYDGSCYNALNPRNALPPPCPMPFFKLETANFAYDLGSQNWIIELLEFLRKSPIYLLVALPQVGGKSIIDFISN